MARSDDKDKGTGAGTIAAGAVAGAGVLTGASVFSGAAHFHPDSDILGDAKEIVKAAIGDKVTTYSILNGGEKEVTPILKEQSKKIIALASDYEKAGFLGKTWMGFKSMPTGTKIGVGAIAVGAAIGAGWAINKMTGGSKESHVERLERERAQNSQREL